MTFLKNIFRSAKNSNGEVKIIDGTTIKSTGEHWVYNCEFDLNKVEYAYLVINARLESYLFVMTANPSRKNHIATTYKGFQDVYRRLSEKYGFADDLFEKYVDAKAPLKVCIWRKKYKQNYSILKETHSAITEGFEIQSPEKEFIAWDLPLEELRTKNGVQIKPNAFGSKTLDFDYPVRIGSVILENMQAIIHKNREDIPVLHFHTKCYAATNTDQSYWELKNYFIEAVGLQLGRGWDRDDQKNTPFELRGMNLSICYTYDSEYGFEAGYTSLIIENNRDYPAVLVDEMYEQKMAISDYQVLQNGIYIAGNYKKEAQIKRRPPKLTELCGEKPLIWRDDNNQKIGFANGRFAKIYEADKIEKIYIQNTLPARGAGRADLEILLQGEEHRRSIFSAFCRGFDDYAEKIETLTGKQVEFLPEILDC